MPSGNTQHKDRINRCYACEGRFDRRESRIRCGACGREYHEGCLPETGELCPRCGGDSWVDAAEF